MTELICNQGHVIDPGRPSCTRCGGFPIGTADVAPVINEASAEEAPRDLETLTAKELKAELSALGVEFKNSDSKAELLEKLKSAVEDTAEDVDDEGSDDSSDEDEL